MIGKGRWRCGLWAASLAVAMMVPSPARAQRGGGGARGVGGGMVGAPGNAGGAFPGYRGYNPITSNPISGVGGGINPFYRGYNPITNSPISNYNPGQFGTIYNNGYNPLLTGAYGMGNNFGGSPAAANASGFVGYPNYAGALYGYGNVGYGYSPYGYGGYSPYGYGLGGYGGYYEPSYIGSGLDWTGYAAGYGGGGLGISIGMSPYDQALYRSQMYDLNASRYNLQNAQATQAYAAANFYSDMANETAYRNYKQSSGMRGSYPIEGTTTAATTPRRARHDLIPRDKLIDSDGHPKWPASALDHPSDLATKRGEVDKAVAAADKESRDNHRASIATVVSARNKLSDYGHAALDVVHAKTPANAPGLALFLNSLDHALLVMGEAPAAVGSTDLRPDDAPKTGGDVLKDAIKDEKAKDANSSTAPKNP